MDKKLIETVKINEYFINKILTRLGLLAVGGFSVPAKGRIPSNIIVTTRECGNVMLRFYREDCQKGKLETGNVDFEVEALDVLAKIRI